MAGLICKLLGHRDEVTDMATPPGADPNKPMRVRVTRTCERCDDTTVTSERANWQAGLNR